MVLWHAQNKNEEWRLNRLNVGHCSGTGRHCLLFTAIATHKLLLRELLSLSSNSAWAGVHVWP